MKDSVKKVVKKSTASKTSSSKTSKSKTSKPRAAPKKKIQSAPKAQEVVRTNNQNNHNQGQENSDQTQAFKESVNKPAIYKICKEGYPFVFGCALITVFFGLLSAKLFLIGLFLTVFCAGFFRDPDRVVPLNDDYIISPADGVVQQVVLTDTPKELENMSGKRLRISIFLNILNVHVNRTPVKGIISQIKYIPGQFFNASLDKSSHLNERNHIVIKTSKAEEIICTQIAGLVARRIVCNIKEGDEVQAGERYGLIRFGSRVDVYLPAGSNALVKPGQSVIGGETILCEAAVKKTIKTVIR